MSSWRLRALGVLLIVVPLALLMKYYSGPGRWWLNNWGASYGYEIFFILLTFIVVPRRTAITAIAIWVCLVTCALELLQLWKPPLLQAVRSTWVGESLLGGQFSWSDLPAYPVGSFLGWLLLHRVVAPSHR
jgi:hypothetical protein